MKSKKCSKEGYFIPAGLFIGLGIGLITGNVPGYMFIGLGAGFLAMMIWPSLMKK